MLVRRFTVPGSKGDGPKALGSADPKGLWGTTAAGGCRVQGLKSWLGLGIGNFHARTNGLS